MSLCTIPKARYFYRICKHVHHFKNFYSFCAFRIEDFIERSNTYNCNYQELQHRMQNYATSGHLIEALETLNSMSLTLGKPTVYDYNCLMHCSLKSCNVSLEALYEVYRGMKRFGFAPNASTFNTLLNGMLSHGYLKFGYSITEEMYRNGFVPSFTFMSKLLKKTLKVGSLADSVSIFEFMLRLNYIPTESSLNLLISKLSKVGKIKEAYLVYSNMLVKGCFYAAYLHNPILWALCKSGQTYTALALMKKKGAVRDVCSYTALIYGLGREGLWEDLVRCLDEMHSYGCKPNTITYTIVIKSLCDNEKTKEALDFLAKMEREGCEPDLITYNVILRELCLKDSVEDSFGLIELIDQKGLSPNPYTYAALVGGLLKREETRVAYKILIDAISKGCADVAVYNIYFHCLCRVYGSREALHLLENKIKQGFMPRNATCNTIFRKLRRKERCRK
nr:pentatricopeptide repeat-containing protein At1g09900-like isoform X1 [Ziziphus jujuba var. spinosa]XP_048324493.1 pentatricopeptide repeat-containing protein At1g09900-like isoform X1 [Ziziphus jujuba var. spinosa]XP_048324494.1 pentatricopeptide repeat-containing protein At1g09900-like isoform X1 [Ziziphus jujuba var. spinosa]XP_048324495.1 pentatricopeptide repeat-containing protein At1g09900-like isoform X1 [Ziziphus jujuba var. spinosa]